METSREAVKLISLPKIENIKGNLTFIEANNHIGFSINKVMWIYNLSEGDKYGGYKLAGTYQFILSLSGSVYVNLKDGNNDFFFYLNSPSLGLYVPPFHWIRIENFLSESVLLILASTNFTDKDYII